MNIQEKKIDKVKLLNKSHYKNDSFMIFDDEVWLKRTKKNGGSQYVGDTKTLNKIMSDVSSSVHTSLLLLASFSPNRNISDFNGDIDKTIEEFSKISENGNIYDHTITRLESRKSDFERNIYGYGKAYRENEIKRIENALLNPSDKIFEQMANQKIFDFDGSNIREFIIHKNKNSSSTWNNRTYRRFKVSFVRKYSDEKKYFNLLSNNINYKTGDVELSFEDELKVVDIDFNMYKDFFGVNESEVFNKQTVRQILSLHYEKNQLIKDIIRQYSYSGDNLIEYYKNITIIIDKLLNLKEYEKIQHLDIDYFSQNINEKTKINNYFGLDKQLYNKVFELPVKEISNFFEFKNIILKYFPHLNSQKTFLLLLDDLFLMNEKANWVERIKPYSASDIEMEMFFPKFSDFKKLVEYLTIDLPNRQRIKSVHAVGNLYSDYLEYTIHLINAKFRNIESFKISPFSLKLEHDIVNDEYQSYKNTINNNRLSEKYKEDLDIITKKTYKYKEEEIVFLPANTVEALVDEGQQLSHCVGSYVSNILQDRCLILLARKKENIDESWFTIELRKTEMGYALGQQQSINKYALPEELKDKLTKDIKKINKNKLENNQESLELSA